MGLFGNKDPRVLRSESDLKRVWSTQQPSVQAHVREQAMDLLPRMKHVYVAATDVGKEFLLVPSEHLAKDDKKGVKEVLALLDRYEFPGASLLSPNIDKYGVKSNMAIVMSYFKLIRPLALKAASEVEGLQTPETMDSPGGAGGAPASLNSPSGGHSGLGAMQSPSAMGIGSNALGMNSPQGGGQQGGQGMQQGGQNGQQQ